MPAQMPDPKEDPEAIARALELELIGKRAGWEKAKEQRGLWRTLSFLFLLLIVLGALVAYFYFLPELSREGASSSPERQSTR